MNKPPPSPSPAPTSSPTPTKQNHEPPPPPATPPPTKSVATVAAFTGLSRLCGLIRDLLFANLIGASAAADAFYVAFRIPNFFRRLFAEGAFSQAFIPVLSDYRTRRTAAQTRHLISRTSGTLGVILLAFTALVLALPGLFAALFAPGFHWQTDAPRATYLTDMLRLTFPYLLLISMTGLASAVLNAYDRFAPPAFTPVLLNICLIAAALLLAPHMAEPAYALAWGVLAAGTVQLLFQLPFLHRLHLLPTPKWGWHHPGVQRILKLMLPAMFGVSVSQINLLLDTLLASFLPTGSVSWLYYADRLAELPLGLIGIALATVILPNLSRQRLQADRTQYRRTLDWALRCVLLLGLPAATALILLAEPILATLFLHGEFTPHDLQMAALALRAYALGLTAFMLVKILAPGYYACEDMRTPVTIGIIALAANMALNLILVPWLHFTHQLGHLGLALTTSLAAALNAALLYRGLRRKSLYRPQPGWPPFLARTAAACALMATALLLAPHLSPLTLQTDWPTLTTQTRLTNLCTLCATGLATYALALATLGLRPHHLR